MDDGQYTELLMIIIQAILAKPMQKLGQMIFGYLHNLKVSLMADERCVILGERLSGKLEMTISLSSEWVLILPSWILIG